SPPASAFPRNVLCVQRIDQRLGPRKSEPGERVEKIVQVVRTCLYPSGLEEVDLVVGVGGCRRNKPDRLAACRAQIQLARQRVQPLERALPSRNSHGRTASKIGWARAASRAASRLRATEPAPRRRTSAAAARSTP